MMVSCVIRLSTMRLGCFLLSTNFKVVILSNLVGNWSLLVLA